MSDSLEEKYGRLQNEIQSAILRSYPNPERRGCPAKAVVSSLALNPDEIRAADEDDKHSAWYHITHCSPCYASFLASRNAARNHES